MSSVLGDIIEDFYKEMKEKALRDKSKAEVVEETEDRITLKMSIHIEKPVESITITGEVKSD